MNLAALACLRNFERDVALPKPVELFVGSHPATLAHVPTPKPWPVSFSTETFFGVTAAEIHWLAERPVVSLGKFELRELVGDDAEEQRTTIFDPIPRVDEIEASADPLLELRAAGAA